MVAINGACHLSGIKTLVLDEADKMFEMGFIDDVKKMVYPVLRHRVIASYNADAEGISVDEILSKLVNQSVSTTSRLYKSILKNNLATKIVIPNITTIY